jgi:hypothetical protein
MSNTLSKLATPEDCLEPPCIVPIYLRHPSTMIIAGPTMCGKTVFVKRLLEHNMFRDRNGKGFDRVIWCYGVTPSDKLIEDVSRITGGRTEFNKGIPNDICKNGIDVEENNLLIIDDLMSEISDSKLLSNLFTRGSHHCNITVVYIVQNLFDRGKSSTTVAKNAHYTVLFKNEKGVNDARVLATQLMPAGMTAVFTRLVQEVTKEPHTYLFIDCHPETPTDYKFRTNIFPGEETTLFIANK